LAKLRAEGRDVSLETGRRRILSNLRGGKGVRPTSLEKYGITKDDLKSMGISEPASRRRIRLKGSGPKASIESLIDLISATKGLSPMTIGAYVGKLRQLAKLNTLSDDFGDFVRSKGFSNKIKEAYPKSYKDYLSPILSLARHNEQLKDVFGEETLEAIRKEMTAGVDASDKKRLDEAENGKVVAWKDILDMNISDKPLMEQLLFRLYTTIAPTRDNMGMVHLVQEESKGSKDENYYVVPKGVMVINKYKTSKTYGPIRFKVPSELKDEIDKSLKVLPRKYLVTKPDGSPYAKGLLTTLVKHTFNGHSINTIRKSFETYRLENFDDFSANEHLLINKLVGHDLNQALLYSRTGKKGETENPMENISKKITGKK
jgi:hypothetical protein